MQLPREAHDCQAKACGLALYEEELWTCADCGDFFCEEHIAEVDDDSGERFMGVTEPGSVHLCHACCDRRNNRKRPGSLRRERDDDGRSFSDDYEDVA
jgi:hypothetical protein